MKRGYCTNLPSRCSKAKTRELIPVTGPRTSCPECGKPVRPIKEPGGNRVGLYVVLAVVAATAIFFAQKLWRDGRELAQHNKRPSEIVASTRISCDNQPVLTLSGSDVLGAGLAPRLAEAWLTAGGVQGIAQQRQGSSVVVTGRRAGQTCAVRIDGPNTADGLSDLKSGKADIAMSPRQLSPDEASAARELGDMRSPAAEHIVAIDALAVIVNPRNPIRTLTRGELTDVFSGRVKSWSALHGPDGQIRTYIGASGNRAADTAGELLGEIGSVASRPASDAGVTEAVADDPLAIGIVSYPAAGNVQTIAIGEQGATAFSPSPDSVATQTYPLTRRLYFYTDPTPRNANTTSFLSFVQSRHGQEVVGKAGYVGQNIQLVKTTLSRSDASTGYKGLVAGARQLNLAFRFQSGRAALDNKALEDLGRLKDFLALQRNQQMPPIVLIGFADAQGTDERNMELSHQRAQAVASALRESGIEPETVRWFGEEQAVGDNSTVGGRERNRRVEVWIK